jgi:hypothetical protein
MATRKHLGLAAAALAALLLLIGRVVAARGPAAPERAALATRPAATTAIELLASVPFVLDEPYPHEWRREQPSARSGLILVLRADPELARPRQTFEPVLYVGRETAERVNAPENGNLVVLVPAPLDAAGAVALDLATTPIWFGSPDLPERVDAEVIERELALALARGAGPATPAERARLRASAGETVHARDRLELDPLLADLIEFYSPEETDLVRGLRVPVTR